MQLDQQFWVGFIDRKLQMDKPTRTQLLRWIGWFFSGNAVLFCLLTTYFLRGITPASINLMTHLNAVLAWVFLIVTWIGHSSLLAFLPALPVIVLLMLCRNQLLIMGSAIFAASLAVLFLITDILVFAQYHFHLNTIVLHFVFSQESNQIFDFTWLEKLLFSVTGIVVLSIEYLFARWLWQFLAKSPQALHGKAIAVTIITCLFLSYDMFLLSSAQPISIIYQQPQAFPFYNNIVSELFSKILPLSDLNKLGSDMIRQPIAYSTEKLNYPLNALHCQPASQPLNIVIIAIDTWRFDMLNQQVTPNITQFAQKCWQFNDHYSGGNTTQPGIFSLFYALPATYWSAALHEQQNPVLMQLLLRQHYQMGIYTSAALTLPAFNKTVFANIPNLDLVTDGKLPADRDLNITNKFAQFIAQAKQKQQPFFSFLFYDTAHSYCTPFPDEQRFHPIITTCNRFDLYPGAQAPLYLNRYKSALYYVDGLVAQDINVLSQQHLLKNTVIIITADHGNEFDDNQQGYWGHGSNFTQYQIRVPLLIFWPGETPHVFQQQTTHYDIAPTLLTRIFGCVNKESDYSVGRVLPTQEAELPYFIVASYIDFGIMEPNHITTIYNSGNVGITDLHNNIIAGAKPNMVVMQDALQEMQRYYRQ